MLLLIMKPNNNVSHNFSDVSVEVILYSNQDHVKLRPTDMHGMVDAASWIRLTAIQCRKRGSHVELNKGMVQ